MARFHELITGFHSFRNEYLLRDKEFFEQLAHGQSPKTLVIACCDSRTDPAIILGCKPGDLFVVRSIAAIVPDKDSAGEHDAVIAAIEYGIKHLQVHDIVVMGHSNCGGIHGLLNPEKIRSEEFISRWVSLALPAFLNHMGWSGALTTKIPELTHACVAACARRGLFCCRSKTCSRTTGCMSRYRPGACVCTPFTMTLDALVLPCGIAKRKISKRFRPCILRNLENLKNHKICDFAQHRYLQ